MYIYVFFIEFFVIGLLVFPISIGLDLGTPAIEFEACAVRRAVIAMAGPPPPPPPSGERKVSALRTQIM